MTVTDNDNTKQLIEDGQALVHSLASKVSRNVPMRVEMDDLIAYGQLGLAEAAREYDPAHGTQFTTFAYYRVRGAIYDGLSKMSWTSRARYNRIRYEQQARETMERECKLNSGNSLDDDARWFRGLTDKLAVVYLASGGRDDEQGSGDAFEDPQESPATVAARRDMVDRLSQVIEKLPTAEKRLIQATYFEGCTLQEAATKLGISKSWASRMHAKILEHLARSLRRMGLTGSI